MTKQAEDERAEKDAELSTLRAECDKLGVLLEPFRRYAEMMQQHFPADDNFAYRRLMVPGEEPAEITTADFRALLPEESV